MTNLKNASLRQESAALLHLAVPVILGNLGMMLLGVIDTVVVGRLNAASVAGVGAGSSIFWAFAVVGIGALTALDTFVSRAVGAGDEVQRDRYFFQGHWLALALSLVLGPGIFAVGIFFEIFGATPDVLATAKPFLMIFSGSILPVLLLTVYQRYWQARGVALPFAVIVIVGNVVNYLAAVGLVHGEFGLPRLESTGAAYATFVTRFAMVFMAVGYTCLRRDSPVRAAVISKLGGWRAALRLDALVQSELLWLGLPAGLQMFAEVTAFALATTMSTRLGAVDSATHHIALTIASFTFMVPMGLSTAGAVRVGTLLGAEEYRRAPRAGWLAIFWGASFMALSGVTLYSFPTFFFGLFTTDAEVISRGMVILVCAAAFQIFDGVQVTGAGVLRGFADTRSSLFANVVGHYPVGLALGLWLCFSRGYGLFGLWVGLSVGLAAVASLILLRFVVISRNARRVASG